jgi:hypothetical protein
MGTEVG